MINYVSSASVLIINSNFEACYDKRNPNRKKLSKENTKVAQNNPLLLLGNYFSGCCYKG